MPQTRFSQHSTNEHYKRNEFRPLKNAIKKYERINAMETREDLLLLMLIDTNDNRFVCDIRFIAFMRLSLLLLNRTAKQRPNYEFNWFSVMHTISLQIRQFLHFFWKMASSYWTLIDDENIIDEKKFQMNKNYML